MIRLFLILSIAHAQSYPDQKLTPGVIATTDQAKICRDGYTKDARHVTPATKRQVFARYGFAKGKFKPGDYEIDHFVSLELGGANDVQNLWPQPYSGKWTAREKDVVETTLHREICAGKITLEEAQRRIRTDWIAEYKRIKGMKR